VENDSIRASGTDTLIDIWIEGKLRALCITKAAIETYLGTAASAEMTDDGRCEFVRTHLSQVVTAARAKLRATDPGADLIVIEAKQLGGVGERRRGNRRKTERRKTSTPPEELQKGERRRGDRRRQERRQRPSTET
jgi:hypothetical protein